MPANSRWDLIRGLKGVNAVKCMRSRMNSDWTTDRVITIREGGKILQTSNLGFQITRENISANYLTFKYKNWLLGQTSIAH